MSQSNSSGYMTFNAEEAIGKFIFVKLGTAANGVLICDAGATTTPIGVTMDAAAINTPVAVRLLPGVGTFKATAAGAVTLHALVYAAAAGKVDDAASGVVIGKALEAATASGDIIEILSTGYASLA